MESWKNFFKELNNYAKATADTTLSAFGASDVITDDMYKGKHRQQWAKASDVTGAIGATVAPIALNLALPGAGTALKGIQKGVNAATTGTGNISVGAGDAFSGINDMRTAYQDTQDANQMIDTLNTLQGLNIMPFGGQTNGYPELEKQEVFQTPQGYVGQVNAPTHAGGGTGPMNLPGGTRVFSDRLKSKSGKTFAQEAEMYKTDKWEKILSNKNITEFQKNTAELMLKTANKKLDRLFAEQEIQKGNEAAKKLNKLNQMPNGGTVPATTPNYSFDTYYKDLQSWQNPSAQHVPKNIADYQQNWIRPTILTYQEKLNAGLADKYKNQYNATTGPTQDQYLTPEDGAKYLGSADEYNNYLNYVNAYNAYRQATMGTYNAPSQTAGSNDPGGNLYGFRHYNLYKPQQIQKESNQQITNQERPDVPVQKLPYGGLTTSNVEDPNMIYNYKTGKMETINTGNPDMVYNYKTGGMDYVPAMQSLKSPYQWTEPVEDTSIPKRYGDVDYQYFPSKQANQLTVNTVQPQVVNQINTLPDTSVDKNNFFGNLGDKLNQVNPYFATATAGNLLGAGYDIYRGIKGGDEVNFERINPELVDFSQARKMGIQETNRGFNTTQKAMREASQGNAGTYLSNINNAAVMRDKGNRQMISQSIENEKNMNSQIKNQAKTQNANIQMQEAIARQQEKDIASNTLSTGLYNLGNALNTYGTDMQLKGNEPILQELIKTGNYNYVYNKNGNKPIGFEWTDDKGQKKIVKFSSKMSKSDEAYIQSLIDKSSKPE